MDDGVIPDDVRQFLLKHIETIAQWEALLLLRSRPDTPRDAASIAGDLYVSEAEGTEVLARLVRRHLVAGTRTPAGVRYAYAPPTAETDALIGRAAELYRHYLILVTHIIHSRQTTRVQAFADAFRMRKD